MIRNLKFVPILLALAVGAFAFTTTTNAPEPPAELAIGEMAPNLHQKLKDLDGKERMLRDFGQQNGMLVVFSCNTCPFVIAWEDRYNDLHDLCEKNGIGMVLVNSNEARRSGDDSFENMKAHAKEQNYKSPYVVDQKSELANAFGARTTPHVFLFDKEMKLAFKGAIDNNYQDKTKASKTFLRDAITNLVAGNPIDPAVSEAKGCSIKRVKS